MSCLYLLVLWLWVQARIQRVAAAESLIQWPGNSLSMMTVGISTVQLCAKALPRNRLAEGRCIVTVSLVVAMAAGQMFQLPAQRGQCITCLDQGSYGNTKSCQR